VDIDGGRPSAEWIGREKITAPPKRPHYFYSWCWRFVQPYILNETSDETGSGLVSGLGEGWRHTVFPGGARVCTSTRKRKERRRFRPLRSEFIDPTIGVRWRETLDRRHTHTYNGANTHGKRRPPPRYRGTKKISSVTLRLSRDYAERFFNGALCENTVPETVARFHRPSFFWPQTRPNAPLVVRPTYACRVTRTFTRTDVTTRRHLVRGQRTVPVFRPDENQRKREHDFETDGFSDRSRIRTESPHDHVLYRSCVSNVENNLSSQISFRIYVRMFPCIQHACAWIEPRSFFRGRSREREFINDRGREFYAPKTNLAIQKPSVEKSTFR